MTHFEREPSLKKAFIAGGFDAVIQTFRHRGSHRRLIQAQKLARQAETDFVRGGGAMLANQDLLRDALNALERAKEDRENTAKKLPSGLRHSHT